MAIFVKCPRCLQHVTRLCGDGPLCGMSHPYQSNLRHEQALRAYEVRQMEENQLLTMVNSQERGE